MNKGLPIHILPSHATPLCPAQARTTAWCWSPRASSSSCPRWARCCTRSTRSWRTAPRRPWLQSLMRCRRTGLVSGGRRHDWRCMPAHDARHDGTIRRVFTSPASHRAPLTYSSLIVSLAFVSSYLCPQPCFRTCLPPSASSCWPTGTPTATCRCVMLSQATLTARCGAVR